MFSAAMLFSSRYHDLIPHTAAYIDLLVFGRNGFFLLDWSPRANRTLGMEYLQVPQGRVAQAVHVERALRHR